MEKALILFIVTYILLMILQKYRWMIALGSGLLFILLGILPIQKVFNVIDWNVIMMIAGTMGIVSLFIESRMPTLLADIIISKVTNIKWVIVLLALFAGIISAFVDNVATVLMIAPVALTIAKKLKISPVPVIIAIAVSSNLQGAATLVGDTTAILLGGYAGMDFIDFFFFHGKPSIFWAVQLGAVFSICILLFLFRKYTDKIEANERTVVEDFFPTMLLIAMVTLLICASFITNKPSTTNGIICLTLLAIGLTRTLIKKKNLTSVINHLKEIDISTLLLLVGLFMIVGGITEAGVIQAISDIFIRVGGNNLFVIYSLIVWASVLFSAFIDNIPYVATMLPVIAGISELLGIEPYLLYFGLLSGATLGGNLTPIGASANITGIGILKKNGYEVKTSDFMKIGVPFTLVAVLSSYLFLWFIWN